MIRIDLYIEALEYLRKFFSIDDYEDFIEYDLSISDISTVLGYSTFDDHYDYHEFRDECRENEHITFITDQDTLNKLLIDITQIKNHEHSKLATQFW